MTTYFGFIPSEKLNQQIEDTLDLVNNRPNEKFYPAQEIITKGITHELLDNMFVYLIQVIEDTKRQAKMKKLVVTVHSAVEMMLKHVLVEQDNEKVLDAFNFLHQSCVFMDNEGQRRVGFKLSVDDAKKIITNFEQAKETDRPHEFLQEALDVIIRTNLDHFILEFSKHLHLGMLKRKAVTMAEMAISKASKVAVNKLLPEMQVDACMRLLNHFEQFLVVVED